MSSGKSTRQVMATGKPKSSFAQKLGWLVLIWTASVMTLALVSVILKFFMKLAGFQVG